LTLTQLSGREITAFLMSKLQSRATLIARYRFMKMLRKLIMARKEERRIINPAQPNFMLYLKAQKISLIY